MRPVYPDSTNVSVRVGRVKILKKDQIKFIGTDKKYFMDFSYPICFEREKFWKPTTDGCLVYSFGVDNKWVQCQKIFFRNSRPKGKIMVSKQTGRSSKPNWKVF